MILPIKSRLLYLLLDLWIMFSVVTKWPNASVFPVILVLWRNVARSHIAMSSSSTRDTWMKGKVYVWKIDGFPLGSRASSTPIITRRDVSQRRKTKLKIWFSIVNGTRADFHLESRLVYQSDTNIDTSLDRSDIRQGPHRRQTVLELHIEFLKSQEANIP